MDNPQFDHYEIHNEYDTNGYDQNNHNISSYGGEQFILDTRCYYLVIGIILYSSFCCFRRDRNRNRDTDLHIPIYQGPNNSLIISNFDKGWTDYVFQLYQQLNTQQGVL